MPAGGKRRLEREADELLESAEDVDARARELGYGASHVDRVGVEP